MGNFTLNYQVQIIKNQFEEDLYFMIPSITSQNPSDTESSDMSESSSNSILYGGKIQKVQEISKLSQQMNQNDTSTKDGSSSQRFQMTK